MYRNVRAACISLGLIAFVVSLVVAQKSDAPPGSVKMLSGYEHQRETGIDTTVGRIWKQDGLTISYDIGTLAGNGAAHRKETGKNLWYREQTFNGHKAQLVLTTDRFLCVTFPENTANFFGVVKTEQDLIDALLMILTYTPPIGKK